MLKKRYRLSKFGRIEKTVNISAPWFLIKVQKVEKKYPEFGFIVSKKIDNKAVVRNRTRRVLQKAIQENIEKFFPYTYLVIARKPIFNEDQALITNKMEEILKKENLIK